MTKLLERPGHRDLTGAPDLTGPSAPTRASGVGCPPHAHTRRCWWHVELAGWVCPPSPDAAA